MTAPARLLTIGHGTATQERLLELLRGAGVEHVVDIRTAPGSRRHPHVGREQLECWLPEAGIAYRWEPRLGGFRKVAADSPDTAWENDSFRGFAGYTRTPDFLAGIDDVVAEAATARTTVMCSESVWWRCHRRLVADVVVLARGQEVLHVMPDGRLAPHRLTPWARLRDDGLLVYDVA